MVHSRLARAKAVSPLRSATTVHDAPGIIPLPSPFPATEFLSAPRRETDALCQRTITLKYYKVIINASIFDPLNQKVIMPAKSGFSRDSAFGWLTGRWLSLQGSIGRAAS